MAYKGKIRMSKKRRVCKFSGCEHILSIYNLDAFCHAHQQLAMTQVASASSAGRQ